MKDFKVTYYNRRADHLVTITVKARSLESAIKSEQEAVALMQSVNPFIELVKVVAA